MLSITGAILFFGGVVFTMPSALASTIYVSGTYNTSTTWIATNVYVVSSSLSIASGTTLTVNSGTVVKFVKDGSLLVNGHGVLNVLGDAANPSYFTALTDSTIGGATNGSTTSTAARGDSGYIRVDANSSTTFNNAFVEYGGHFATYPANIYQLGGTLTLASTTVASSSNYGFETAAGTSTISSSTIANNALNGIEELNSSGNLTLANNIFSSNGSSALTSGDAYLDLNNGLVLAASGDRDLTNVTGTSGYRGIGVNASAMTKNIELPKDTLPYVIYGGVTVGSGTTLTIDHGAIVKFPKDKNIWAAGGTLNVSGISTDPVYFTAITDDSIGGDTNANGTSTAAKGDSGYFLIDSTSTLNNAIIAYGGHFATYPANIYQLGGTLTLASTTVASSSNYGLDTTAGRVTITSSTITNNASDGIYESGSSGSLTLTNSTFSTNGSSSQNTGDAYVSFGNGITFNHSGNNDNATTTRTGYRGLIVAGTLAASTTWYSESVHGGLPYVIQSLVTVASGTTLTIGPGALVKFSQGAYLDVASNGTLIVNPDGYIENGTVYFTALSDDFGGDTNSNGTSTTPNPGDGGYIKIESGASSTIDLTDFLYGGHSTPGFANIYQVGGILNISNTTIASSSNYGLRLAGGTSTITNSYFFNNPYGIYMTTGTLSVASSGFEGNTTFAIDNTSNVSTTAKNNYWNSYTGPTNVANPGGTGDSVSSYVYFTPFVNNNGARNHYLTLSCVDASLATVFCSSVQNSSTLLYDASTTYSSAWNAAVNYWNTASGTMPISITSTTVATSSAYVNVYDVNQSDLGWVGLWTPVTAGQSSTIPTPVSSTIEFNQYYADTFAPANLQNLTEHELGHALGLSDEGIVGNVEFLYNTSQTTLGHQDLSDYYYLW